MPALSKVARPLATGGGALHALVHVHWGDPGGDYAVPGAPLRRARGPQMSWPAPLPCPWPRYTVPEAINIAADNPGAAGNRDPPGEPKGDWHGGLQAVLPINPANCMQGYP